ncbi:MAG: IS1634 family transposase [Desulfobacterales bacterium]
MHLSYSTSQYKGQTYKSYSLAESYREGKKVKKRTIWPIGKLSDQQAEQIRSILKVVQGDHTVTRLADIVVKDTKAYLDIAVINEFWNRWKLDEAFNYDVTDSPLPTYLVAKILTINRCTDPCSHYSVPQWLQKTALEQILEVNLSGLNDDKIYYELDKINKNKMSIENHLFKQTFSQNPESFDFVNYDLSTTYFVGYKCSLSAFGKGKAECHGRRQVLLGVLINDEGYPFKWDVFPGNTAEVKTLKRNLNALKTRFGLKERNLTFVFDRGIISDENASLIEEAQMKFISALDRNQIPSCGVELEPFKGLEVNQADKRVPLPSGFKKYDDQLYFEDTGLIGDKRYVLGFNPVLFAEDRKTREEKMNHFKAYLKKENKDLKKARKDRELEATKNRIVKELKRLKIQKYFETPVLEPLIVSRKLKDGTKKSVHSFQVQVKAKADIIKADKLLDGLCVFLTNHTEKQGRGFKVKPETIIKAYRDKTKIEDVFKNVKSFLKLRPFFVNTDAHVKAVYTICILAYFINRYLANQRKEAGEKDFLNSRELYAPFKDIDIATLADKTTGNVIQKPVELPPVTTRLLKKIGLSQVALSP